MNEYELIMKSFSENENMEVYKLEEKYGYKIIMSKQKYLHNNNYFYTNPIYQLFNKEGKRIISNSNYGYILALFNRLIEKEINNDNQEVNHDNSK